ncbi:hypothetical protein [Ruminiclostridium papyrosolvens]|uniref:Uncharacterized protein n=1 Tax=Ruminiclostridium papyrosolvens C7 TaxID=1330534 RepID=U4R5P0_9FIRM|nr:hypothetical protein [Ruminiclostridium papyrosolvens]EPR13903.1 hypothetical protein L323_02210 [Ruminiclostridium papyrosolvens C7]
MKHFTNFLRKGAYFKEADKFATYLKQGIINLNNALELLMKKAISDINEIIIFESKSKDKVHSCILEYYKLKRNNKIDIPLYDFVILKDPKDLKTIDYKDIIDLYCDLFDVGDALRDDFKELNKIRNSFIHLGIDYKQEYYKLAGHINSILWFLQFIYFKKFKYNKRKLDSLLCNISQVGFGFSQVEETLYKELFQNNIDMVGKDLEQTFNDTEVQTYIKEKNVDVAFGYGSDAEFINASMSLTNENDYIELVFVSNHPKIPGLIIDDGQQNGRVFAVFTFDNCDKAPVFFYCASDYMGIQVEDAENQKIFGQKILEINLKD